MTRYRGQISKCKVSKGSDSSRAPDDIEVEFLLHDQTILNITEMVQLRPMKQDLFRTMIFVYKFLQFTNVKIIYTCCSVFFCNSLLNKDSIVNLI